MSRWQALLAHRAVSDLKVQTGEHYPTLQVGSVGLISLNIKGLLHLSP